MGLEKPADGSIETGGVRFSAVFQEDRLLPFKTVLENITLIGAEKETAARKKERLNAFPRTSKKSRCSPRFSQTSTRYHLTFQGFMI